MDLLARPKPALGGGVTPPPVQALRNPLAGVLSKITKTETEKRVKKMKFVLARSGDPFYTPGAHGNKPALFAALPSLFERAKPRS